MLIVTKFIYKSTFFFQRISPKHTLPYKIIKIAMSQNFFIDQTLPGFSNIFSGFETLSLL